jgi:hypothetical protein
MKLASFRQIVEAGSDQESSSFLKKHAAGENRDSDIKVFCFIL